VDNENVLRRQRQADGITRIGVRTARKERHVVSIEGPQNSDSERIDGHRSINFPEESAGPQ
jgi:hypothetical protein